MVSGHHVPPPGSSAMADREWRKEIVLIAWLPCMFLASMGFACPGERQESLEHWVSSLGGWSK